MAYDAALAERIRDMLHDEIGLREQRMFGGLAFLVNGNMAVSASSHGGLLLHIDPARAQDLIEEPHVRRAEMRGRIMDGWLRIGAEALQTDDDLRAWVAEGVTYARSLSSRTSPTPRSS